MENYEEVSNLTLADDDRETLLKTQNECVFTWRTSDGWPIGVVMSYVWRDGKIWLTASSQRPRIRAVRRDDRVSVAISSAGTRMPPATITIKGRCAILEDVETKRWFYPALAAALIPRNENSRLASCECSIRHRQVLMRMPERFITFRRPQDGRYDRTS